MFACDAGDAAECREEVQRGVILVVYTFWKEGKLEFIKRSCFGRTILRAWLGLI